MNEESLRLARACEMRIVNAWPAPATLILDDWAVRFANGYSGRANSASALRPGAGFDEETLRLVESLYREVGLPPRIRFTPLVSSACREMLAARGYRVETASHGMIAALDSVRHSQDPELRFEGRAGDAWVDGVSQHQTGSKRNRDHLAAIVSGVRLPAAFAVLHHEGAPAAWAMSVAERGMAEIGAVIVAPQARGRGLGRRIVAGLMGWAAAQGCAQAYLQVDQTNDVAHDMYVRMGFSHVYSYETRVLDGA